MHAIPLIPLLFVAWVLLWTADPAAASGVSPAQSSVGTSITSTAKAAASILDHLAGGPASVVSQFLGAGTACRLFAVYGTNPLMGSGIKEILAHLPNAVHAKQKVYSVLANPQPLLIEKLYKDMETCGYKVGEFVMMLDRDTPNHVLAGLVDAFKYYGLDKVKEPLHAMFAFAPAVVMKLIYLADGVDFETKRYSIPQNAYWLGFDSARLAPVNWIHANNAGPGSYYPKLDHDGERTENLLQRHQYAKYDNEIFSREPWVIPAPATLETELPQDIDVYNAVNMFLFAMVKIDFKIDMETPKIDHQFNIETSKWVHFGNDWTVKDVDNLKEASWSGTTDWIASMRKMVAARQRAP